MLPFNIDFVIFFMKIVRKLIKNNKLPYVVIPIILARNLDLNCGDFVEIEKKNNKIVIEKVERNDKRKR